MGAGTGFVAAAVTGVGSAVVTRALMRAVAVLTNDDLEFSLGALVLIAAFYTLALLPGCLSLALSPARWPWLVFAAGVGVLMFQAVAIGLQETDDARGVTGSQQILLALVLLAMLATYTAQAVIAARWSRRGFRRHALAGVE